MVRALTLRLLLVVPANSAVPAALVLGFHGQGYSPESWPAFPRLRGLARATGVVFAAPAGIDEGDPGWNCGAAANVEVCDPGTQGACLRSCEKLKRCGRCNWATCYDDVFFVEKMFDYIRAKRCVDDARTFAIGVSNGGMLVHLLSQKLLGMFKAMAAVFASPLLGFALEGDDERLRQTSLFQLLDMSDETIPWRLQRRPKTAAWAAVHRCDVAATPVKTPFTGGETHVDCFEHRHCSEGRVGRCMRAAASGYDGGHGEWPSESRGERLVWSFFGLSKNETTACDIKYIVQRFRSPDVPPGCGRDKSVY
ncbi:hypothetical protein M885DRAFT_618122 [Pelagophyceae sp. CCMP2097]|nr:hypothetical protein M885DRAFT_618122 [Pelagophyceae sp. CCMP2097]